MTAYARPEMDTSLHTLKDQRIHTDKCNVMEANHSETFLFSITKMTLVSSKFNQTHCDVMFFPLAMAVHSCAKRE